MNKLLETKIDKWLVERRKSERGGWAEITAEDIDVLYEIIEDLVEAKCETDADGDTPVEVEIINRRLCERNHYTPIPYLHEAKTEEAKNEIFRELVFNLKMATEAVQNFIRHTDIEQRLAAEKKK